MSSDAALSGASLPQRNGVRRGRWFLIAAMITAAAVYAAQFCYERFMAKIDVGDAAPNFTALAGDGRSVRLSDYLHKQIVVLYFYPKDDTPGCTTQACGFRDAFEDFNDAGAVVLGVSSDTVESHRRFAAERKLPFLLLSDADGAIRKAYGVPKTFGLLPGRVTYVIDRDGVVQHRFNSQFFAGRHVNEALKIVRELAAK